MCGVLMGQFGYRTTPEIMQFLKDNIDLTRNLSAAAHLIHGSSEGRFRITYCPGHLTKEVRRYTCIAPMSTIVGSNSDRRCAR